MPIPSRKRLTAKAKRPRRFAAVHCGNQDIKMRIFVLARSLNIDVTGVS